MRWLAACLIVCCSVAEAREKKEIPPQECHQLSFAQRHTEHRGIGYYEGYTTLQLFFLPSREIWGFYPYCDARGHFFNDGTGAFNAGIGARFIKQRVWGFNTYYDFRKTPHKLFHQIATGFETMGERWDFFANGYLVVGDKKSHGYHQSFDHFAGNNAYYKERVDYAMSGYDAKVRYHWIKKKEWDLYSDLGTYGYFRKNNAIGLQAKLGAMIADCIFVEANTSYDHFFKWIGQGVFGFSIPLGKKDCAGHASPVMRDRLMQMPATQEIIVVDHHKHKFLGIDPLTGLPLNFLFVNNLFGSSGTYEDPYGSLAAAEAASATYDLIYVYPGNGTTTGMANGITLKNYQQLLGSGTAQPVLTQKGTLTIPAQTSTMPLVTNTAGYAVALATHNTVAGLHIQRPTDHAIHAVSTSDVCIRDNVFTLSGSSKYAIYLGTTSFSGTSTISGNTITDGGASRGIYLWVGNTVTLASNSCTVNIVNNQISTHSYGIHFDSNGDASVTNLRCLFNTIATSADRGIYSGGPHNQGQLNYWVSNNTVSRAGGIAMYMENREQSVATGVVTNNLFKDSSDGLRIGSGDAGSKAYVTASDNTFSNNTTRDFYAEVPAAHPGYLCVKLTGNTAPTKGYQFKCDVLSQLNVATFSDNTGSINDTLGTQTVTYLPTCN